MRDYARGIPSFWTRGSGKLLRGNPEAQSLAWYLFTCPHGNMIGLYHLALPTAAHELGWPIEQALVDVIDAQIAAYDPVAELVFLPRGAHYQIAPSLGGHDKRIRGVERELVPYLDHEFGLRFLELYRGPYNLSIRPRGEGWIKATPFSPAGLLPSPRKIVIAARTYEGASQGASESHRSQDQDQEQEQAHATAELPPGSGGVLMLESPGERRADPVSEVWSRFLAVRSLAKLAGGAPKLTTTTRSHIRARLRSFSTDDLETAARVVYAPGSFWLEHGHTAPKFVFRSDDQVQMLLGRAAAAAPAAPRKPPLDFEARFEAERQKLREDAARTGENTPDEAAARAAIAGIGRAFG